MKPFVEGQGQESYADDPENLPTIIIANLEEALLSNKYRGLEKARLSGNVTWLS